MTELYGPRIKYARPLGSMRLSSGPAVLNILVRDSLSEFKFTLASKYIPIRAMPDQTRLPI